MWSIKFPKFVNGLVNRAEDRDLKIVAERDLTDVFGDILEKSGDFSVRFQWGDEKADLSAMFDFIDFIDSYIEIYEWLKSRSSSTRIDFLSQGFEHFFEVKKHVERNKLEINCLWGGPFFEVAHGFPYTRSIDLSETEYMFKELLQDLQKVYISGGYYSLSIQNLIQA